MDAFGGKQEWTFTDYELTKRQTLQGGGLKIRINFRSKNFERKGFQN